jgi:hypothetical protein
MAGYSVVDVVGAIKHLREEADFNRSWTDGRRSPPCQAYTSRRIEIAEQCERWAQAVETLMSEARDLAADRALATIKAGA